MNIYKFPEHEGMIMLGVSEPCRPTDKLGRYSWGWLEGIGKESHGKSISQLYENANSSWEFYRFYRKDIRSKYHSKPVPLP